VRSVEGYSRDCAEILPERRKDKRYSKTKNMSEEHAYCENEK
jgi:hypothetical protein